MGRPLGASLQSGFYPDPESAALVRVDALLAVSGALVQAVQDYPVAQKLLLHIATGSPFLWQLIEQRPERAAVLLQDAPEVSLTRILSRARCAGQDETTEEDIMRTLRLAKQECALLTAFADLGGVWDVPLVTEALSDLADASLAASLSFLLREAAERGKYLIADPDNLQDKSGLIVLAMGKHGARELNYSSDIDLIVLYDLARCRLREDVEPAPFFVRLVQRLVRIMQERTPDGYVFRTDLRLRPDPGSTAVAVSTEAALAYYESVGQNWERAAMLKARPCAGDHEAGNAFLRELVPFVWRKHLDYAAIADVHAMKRQIHAHRGHGQIAVEGHNVKLGRGGIREIEFFVQTQQLVAGGRNSALRVRGTEEGLTALAQEKWIETKVCEELIQAYRYLRRIEHRIQMVNDEQTHTLPNERKEMESFAHFAGYKSRKHFATELTSVFTLVQAHYAHLFEDAPSLSSSLGNLVFSGDGDDPETLYTLGKMGFADPVQASGLVRGWHHGRYNATRSARARELLTELVPVLLDSFALTSSPGTALLAFDSLLKRMPAGVEFLAMLRSNPGFTALLADILGSAPRLSDMVARRPHVLDAMLEPAFFASLPDEDMLSERLQRSLDEATGYEDALNRARIFGQEQMVLVGMRVLSNVVSAEQAGAAFACVAQTLVKAMLTLVQDDMISQYGKISGMKVAILALGKLGGREMTAASDLDLIVLYDHNENCAESDGARSLAPAQYFARLTQRLVAALSAPTGEGLLYEVDFRLRPSGRSGPLATRLCAFERYQHEDAWAWEHMALTRARPVAGDSAFCAKIEGIIKRILCLPRDAKKLAREVVSMRRALASEKAAKDMWDLKYARGGLVDLEFAAQFLQLRYAHLYPGILNVRTARVFDQAYQLGLIDSEQHEQLTRSAVLHNNLTQILRLCISVPFVSADAPSSLRFLLARASYMPDFTTLMSWMKEIQEQAGKVTAKILKVSQPIVN